MNKNEIPGGNLHDGITLRQWKNHFMDWDIEFAHKLEIAVNGMRSGIDCNLMIIEAGRTFTGIR